MKKETTASASKSPAKTGFKRAKLNPVEPNQLAETEESKDQLKVDVDYLKTTNLHCVVHCPSGNISENTFISFVKFGNVARQLGIEWSVETTVNETIPGRAKNMLAAKFMTLAEKTHILFIDPEIGFEPWHVLVMLDRKVDVISGLYPLRTLPIRWSVSTFEGAEEGEEGLHEVDKVGSGFLLVKRNVFEQLRQNSEVKQFKNEIGLGEEFDNELYSYFTPQIVDNHFFNEDSIFCALWRAQGNKIWVDKRVTLAHKGFFNYSSLAQDILLNSFGPMYVDLMKSSGKIQVIENAQATEAAPDQA